MQLGGVPEVLTEVKTAYRLWSSGLCVTSARNGNLEVPVYFLKAKQGYNVRKMK
jgi:hypothetical protein